MLHSDEQITVWAYVKYSLFQKKRTFNSEFFGGPLEEGGPKKWK